MSDWREVELGRGLRVKHGWAFKGEHFRDAGEQIVLTPGNFHDKGGFKPKNGTEKFYDGTYPEQFLLKRGDVVTAMTEQARGLLGSTATIPKDDTYLHNQRIGLIEITDPEVLDLRYVYHLMNAAVVRRQLYATATGAKVRHTAPERIQSVQVEVPDILTQRVIAELLDGIDGLIENNRRRVAVLEEMARAIYREWFVKFRYPGHEDVPIVDSTLGPIPEGWEVSTCGAELNFIGGGTPSKSEPSYWDGGTVAWYTPTDLTKTGWRYAAPSASAITGQGLAKSSARLFPAGSVMMTSRATLGVLAIATTEATTNQGFIVILPDERWSPGFVYEWLDSKAGELSALGTGATFKEITKGSF
ncbi:MAG: restriction endonuclease subunit S, partial [Propionibacterium sp.]|nr:restriction endonuclease subunit S [Propionibacterium sp.]